MADERDINALRYYVTRLEGDLASEEYQHARTKIQLENAQEHISDQAFDIVTLGQEVGRLREALEQIASGGLFQHAHEFARAALAEKED